MAVTRITFGRKPVGSKAKDRDQSVSFEHDLKKSVPSTRVKFGNVVVHTRKPDKAEVLSNVEYSTEALRRSKYRLAKSGVTIRQRKDVPLYYVDENDAAKFIRKLNGRLERGVLENGVFKVTS
jgi:hypothetical protein